MKDKMMICTLPVGEGCYWRVEGRCILSDHYCEYRQPACIPYEPKPQPELAYLAKTDAKDGEFVGLQRITEPDCPDCGDPIFSHCEYGCMVWHPMPSGEAAPCYCKRTPADLQQHSVKVQEKQCPEPPAPQMPLIAIPSVCTDVHKWAEKQRDADMAWHTEFCKGCIGATIISVKPVEAQDSAIASKAVKEFADRVCEDMPLAPFIGGLNPESPEAFDLLKKGIALRQNICNWVYRAMAEGKE